MSLKSVAIVGTADSSVLVKDTPAQECWTMSHVAMLCEEKPEKFPFTPDLVLEVHTEAEIRDIALGEQGDRYWRWLKKKHDFPILMQEKDRSVPSSETYPLEDVKSLISGVFVGEQEQNEVFASSADYLVALAIYRGVKDIYFYGVTFGLETEYRYQVAGFHFWMGVAIERGICIHLPEGDNLFEQKAYGYNAWVRITPKTVRETLREVKKQGQKAEGEDKVRWASAEWLCRRYLEIMDGEKSVGRESLEHALKDFKTQHAGYMEVYNQNQNLKNYNNVLKAEGPIRLIENWIRVCDLLPDKIKMKPVATFVKEE